MGAIIAWLNRDIWGPMWPNVFAPSVFTVLGIAISHVRLKAHHERKLNELHDKLTDSRPE